MSEDQYKIKILIVDDSELVTSVMTKFFREYSFEVLTCNDGLSGIKVAVEEKPDLIFLDLSMPRLSGFDMMKVLRSLEPTKNIPVIVITAHDDNKSISEALKEGASKVIIKPITKKSIIIEVEQVLGYSIFSNIQTQRQNAQEEKMKYDDKILADDEGASGKYYTIKSLVRSIDSKVKEINSYLEARNEVQLKSTVFELAGVSKKLGISRLNSLCDYLTQALIKPNDQLDWGVISQSAQNLTSFLQQLKANNSSF